ncbi:DUF4397 domain-containing protein [Herbiconiux sp. L3-i23]|uniref:DUF4397 domain-containing protein n=1 Tax=Herbiconiux sp. L3-i23 TaxID=2905871 RepID=UPI002069BB5A|nr:DUF4397 domain-containing protein [Herbiconiux sp. L3-i23]BDI23090.1 hypothetical protein L3i23_18660 [Herbiconiux sp. L3-i23]
MSSRKIRTAGAAIATGVLVLAPAAAGFAAPTGDVGYIRVAHLSPDTTPVDLTLTALAGDSVVYEQSGIGYGAVSAYLPLAPGTYGISMVPTGEPSDSTPVLSGEIEVKDDMAATIAGIGPNAELQSVVIDDDFTAPSDGTARVRVVQASALADSVDVTTADGTELARGAALADVGDYVDVPAGSTELSLVAGTTEDVATTDLAAGSVHTLFVVDDADGALTVTAALDSAGVDQAPIGGVDTGGGALATADRQTQVVTMAGLAAIVVAAAAVVFARVRRGARSSA